MRSLTAAAFLLLAGCALPDQPVVFPPPPPPPPQPAPVDPGPVIPPDPVPPITPGAGKISEQQYGGLQEGIEESALVATLGAPFRTVTAAGYRILEYSFDADHVATFWIKNGTTTVERKNRK